MRRFELVEGKSSKFWQVELAGSELRLAWGRIGTNGQAQTKAFADAGKAQAEHDKLVAEKLRKGYVEVGAVGSPAPVATAAKAPPAAPAAPPVAAPPVAAPPVAELAPAATPAPPAPAGAAVPPAGAPALASSAGAPAPSTTPASPPPAAAASTPAAAPPPAPAAPSDSPSIEWTDALAALARKQARALEPKKPAPRSAASAFRSLGELVVTHEEKLRADLAGTPPPLRERAERFLDTYAARKLDPPAKLDPEVETTAALVIPTLIYDYTVVADQLVALWAGVHGLPFAVEVVARTFADAHLVGHPVSPWMPLGKAQLELAPGPATSFIEARDLLGSRLDLALQAAVRAADPAEAEAAKARAAELRAGAGPLGRSVLAAAFLEPAWVDETLAERAAGRFALVTERMIAAVPDPATLARGLAELSGDELSFLTAGDHRSFVPPTLPVAAVLLERHREAALPALAAWVARLAIHASTSHWTTDALRQILEATQTVSGHRPLLAAAAQAVENATGHLSLSKAEDFRPLAVAMMRRSPALALEVLAPYAQKRWAKELLPQLRRLAEASAVPLDEAAPAEVPVVLTKARKSKLPAFFAPEGFTRPLLANGKALPLPAVTTLGAILQADDREALAAAKEACTPASLAAFAWDLFQAWLTTGGAAKDKWAFLALGRLGNDDTARRLTPLVRAWPGESAHARAVTGLDVLAEIGTDVALMQLHGIAQKLKFKGLQDRAREKIEEIARARDLTADELADRLVPDLGLEDDGSLTLDFGARSFRVGFDEGLLPFVRDPSGARLRDLPKPGKADEPELAQAAVATWKAMKKDAKTLAAQQLLRLELAMCRGRRFGDEVFATFLVGHPLLVHVVRRLVWGVYDGDRLVTTFRVAEDRSLADVDDEPFELPARARVGIVHPLELDADLLARWSERLSDYELAQPFEQLARRSRTKVEADAFLEAFDGKLKFDARRVMGLLSRGWERGAVEDAGFWWELGKDLGFGVRATLTLSDGVNVIGEYTTPEQTAKVELTGGHPIALSELCRDLEHLARAGEGAA